MPHASLQAIVAEIEKLWLARLERLPNFIEETFGLSLPHPQPFERLVIMQVSDGSFEACLLGTSVIAQWVWEEDGLYFVPENYFWDVDATDASGTHFLTPTYCFYLQEDQIVLSESYGPKCQQRLRGRLMEENVEDLRIDWDDDPTLLDALES